MTVRSAPAFRSWVAIVPQIVTGHSQSGLSCIQFQPFPDPANRDLFSLESPLVYRKGAFDLTVCWWSAGDAALGVGLSAYPGVISVCASMQSSCAGCCARLSRRINGNPSFIPSRQPIWGKPSARHVIRGPQIFAPKFHARLNPAAQEKAVPARATSWSREKALGVSVVQVLLMALPM